MRTVVVFVGMLAGIAAALLPTTTAAFLQAAGRAQAAAGPRGAINRSPLFEAPDGWGPGYALATGHGPGVVVGPISTSPNVFGQSFPTRPGQQYTVTARASSVDEADALAAIQISWHNEAGTFISVTQRFVKVGPAEHAFHHTAIAPPGASRGILYVVPGGGLVRYTEMTLRQLSPLRDFLSYSFLGMTGEGVL